MRSWMTGCTSSQLTGIWQSNPLQTLMAILPSCRHLNAATNTTRTTSGIRTVLRPTGLSGAKSAAKLRYFMLLVIPLLVSPTVFNVWLDAASSLRLRSISS